MVDFFALGQDANYDQQNYHFYVPYALFNYRILYDIFPDPTPIELSL